MATALLAWECGGGNGHLTRYRNLISHLHDQGHSTYFAVRNLRSASRIFPDQKVALLAAPLRPKNPASNNRPHNRVIQPASYLDVLINQCFDNQEGLEARIRAWLSIFRAVDPRLIIFDHSPTALIAYQAFSERECLISGDGFAVPPSRAGVLPFLQNSSGLTKENLRQKDAALVEQFLNPCLVNFNGPRLKSCMDIFNHPQQIFGIPELDHYPNANRADQFIGDQRNQGGVAATWPKTAGPRVYIYSENHPHLQILLRILTELKWPVIAVAKQPARKLMSQFQSESFNYFDELVDIEQVAKACDFAITNANMTTCMNFIRQGKPMLMLPAHIEQTMFAQRLMEKNCAINLGQLKTAQEIKQSVLQIGDSGGRLHTEAQSFAAEIQPSLEMNADELFIEKVMSLLE